MSRTFAIVTALVAASLGAGAAPPTPKPENSGEGRSQCERMGAYPATGFDSGVPWNDLDPEAALPACEAWLAAHPDDAEALAAYGRLLAKDGWPEESFRTQRWAMALGSISAIYHLALDYLNGDGTEQNPRLGIELARRAADAGYLPAIDVLADNLLSGEHIEQDIPSGLALLRRAAEGGLPYSMNMWGHALANDEYFEDPDYDEARRWQERAGEAGYAEGYYDAGWWSEHGWHGPQSWRLAREYYEKADEMGHSSAAYRLGLIYLSTNKGETQDYEKANAYFLKAAKKGHASAALTYAGSARLGEGMDVDLDLAAHWYGIAAEAGSKDAGYWLAVSHMQSPDYAERGNSILAGLVASAEDNRGVAIAALAYPKPRLGPFIPDSVSETWRETLRTSDDVDMVSAAAAELIWGRMADVRPALGMELLAAMPLAREKTVQARILRLRQLNLYAEAVETFLEAYKQPDRGGLPGNAEAWIAQVLNFDDHWKKATAGNLDAVTELAELGVPRAAHALASYYATPRMPWRDEKKTVRWLRRGVELGHENSRLYLADQMKEHGAPVEEVEELLEPVLARKTAKTYLAQALTARGEADDYARAAELLEDGDEIVDDQLYARLLWEGRGVEEDRERAFEILFGGDDLFRDWDNIYAAAEHLAAGAGVPKDEARAHWLWQQLEKHTYWYSAPLELARASAYGIGTPVDLAETRRWLEDAYVRGFEPARSWLDQCSQAESVDCFLSIDRFQFDLPSPAPPLANAHLLDLEQRAHDLEATLLRRMEETGDRAKLVDPMLATFLAYELVGDGDEFLRIALIRKAMTKGWRRLHPDDAPGYNELLTESCEWAKSTKILARHGKSEAAIFFAKQAVSKLQEARAMLEGIGSAELNECFLQTYEDRYRLLADLYIEAGRFAEAENTLRMLKHSELAEYLRSGPDTEAEAQTLALSESEQDLANIYEAAVSALAEGRDYDDAKDTYAAANSVFRQRLGEIRDVIADAGAERTGIAGGQALARVDEVDTGSIMRNLRKRLDGNAVALHSVVLPDQLHWIISTPEYQQAITLDVGQNELRRLVGKMRGAIVSSGSSEAQQIESAQAAYDRLFRPVDEALRRLGIEMLMLSLDDGLRYIPFAALHDGEDYLVRRYAMSLFQDVRDAGDGADADRLEVAAFGMSEAAAGFDPLPMVPGELGRIVEGEGGIVPGSVYLNGAFTRETFEAEVGGDVPVLHIASHFKLDPRSIDESALLLGSGELLTLKEFFEDGSFTFRSTEFMALSACQTALAGLNASGKELDSLAMLAQSAGVPAVMASLWSVNDNATAELMPNFYASWTDSGSDKAAALRSAQLAMIDDPEGRFRSPRSWAAFVLMGDWT